MSKIILVTGGARSGKSKFAEELAERLSQKVAYIATAEALDEEMKLRIQKHRERRPANWLTVEEPIELAKAVGNLNGAAEVILIDCLTLWLSNAVCRGRACPAPTDLFNHIRQHDQTLILVSNEVGMGIVPDNAMARQFQDEAGRLNQLAAKEADEVYFMVSGIPMKVK